MRDFDLQPPPIDAWSTDDDSIGEQTTNHFADDGEWITEIELDDPPSYPSKSDRHTSLRGSNMFERITTAAINGLGIGTIIATAIVCGYYLATLAL